MQTEAPIRQERRLSAFLSRSVLLNALFVSEAGLSFLVDVAIGATLGLSAQSDAFYAAFFVPQTVGRWMFQSLTNSFMGFFDDEEDTERKISYSQAITVIALAALSLSAFLSLSSPGYVPWIIPAAALKTKLRAVSLARLLAWTICFLGPTETFRAIYYREATWWFPSVARLVGGGLAIVVILSGGRGATESTVVLGVMIGAFAEMVASFIGLRWQITLNYRFSWPDRHTLRSMATLIGAPMAGQGIMVMAGAGERALASLLPPGSITAVVYAGRIISALRRSVFRGFVTTTIYNHVSGSQTDVRMAMRQVALITIPLTVILGTMSHPLIAVAFGRGRFGAQAIETLALTLQFYAPAIIGIALIQVPFGMAYGQRRSWAVFGYFASISAVLLIAEWTLLQAGLGLRAFGWGHTMAFGTTFVWFYPLVTGLRPWRVFSLAKLARFLGVGVVVWLGTSWTASLVSQVETSLGWPSALTLAAGLMGCGGLFVGTTYLLKVPEFRQLLYGLRKKGRQKYNSS